MANKPDNSDKSKKDEQPTTDETSKASEDYVWVDKKGRKPIHYMLPVYLIIGSVFILIWILIFIFAIIPYWKEHKVGGEVPQTQPDFDRPVFPIEIGD